ncbi:MAG: o-succinylbenzoate synthase [Balneolales bacterium]|nr:o-succinylbenzoate synthase [Balneolales bacterium]
MKLNVYTYSLPFKKPFAIAGKTFHNRTGFILVLKEGERYYLSEAAPLPGFSEETESDLSSFFERLDPRHLLPNPEVTSGYEQHHTALKHLPPSLQFAFSGLWHKRLAVYEDKPFTKLLYPYPASRVSINATIGMGTPEEVTQQARQAVSDGFTTIKMKVGNDFDQEFNTLRLLRKSFPSLKIRIDANGAWSTKEAAKNLKNLEPLNIEYCEQPIGVDKAESMAWLRSQTHIKIAVDESVKSLPDVLQILKLNMADLIVVKPMLLGKFSNFMSLVSACRSKGVQIVVTSLLDSGIGRMMSAQLASLIVPSIHDHGLATGNLLLKDTISDAPLIYKARYATSNIPAFEEASDLQFLNSLTQVFEYEL